MSSHLQRPEQAPFVDLPKQWGLKQLRYVAIVHLSSVNKKAYDGQTDVRLCNYTDVYYENEITSDLELMKATASPDNIRELHLRAGDVIVTKDSESWDDIGVPTYVPETLPGVVCAYHLAIIRPSKHLLDGRFLFYVLACPAGSHQFHLSANGVTRYGLNKADIEGAWIPLPPLSEQRRIANFLDTKMERLGTILPPRLQWGSITDDLSGTAVGQLLVRAKEYRRSLITAAVTGRLDLSSDEEIGQDEGLAR